MNQKLLIDRHIPSLGDERGTALNFDQFNLDGTIVSVNTSIKVGEELVFRRLKGGRVQVLVREFV